MSNKYTPGPWQWEVNKKMKQLHLAGGKPKYDQYVLGFERWGMQNGQPTFNIDNRMTKAQDLTAIVEDREHHEDWFRTLSHPDAKLIAAAPDLLEALQLYVDLCKQDEDAYDILQSTEGGTDYRVASDQWKECFEKCKTAIKKATE